MPVQKGKSVAASRQTSKPTSSRGPGHITKAKNKKEETKEQAVKQQPQKMQQKSRKRAEVNDEPSAKKRNVHKPVPTKRKQPQRNWAAAKHEEPNMKRSISILLLGVVLVSIYALFTDDLAVLSNTTKGIIIVFLLFIGFNSLLIFLGYRLGLKKNKK